MKSRTGPVERILIVVFALPFAGGGVLAIVTGIRAGTPSSGVVGLAFVAASAFLIRRALRAGRSPEADAGVMATRALADGGAAPALDYRAPARRDLSARETYGPVLDVAPLPRLAVERGRVLAYALRRSTQKDTGLLLFATLWNLFTIPFFLMMLAAGAWLNAVFLGIFVMVGVVLVGSIVRRRLAVLKVPRVEVSDEPAFAGDPLTVHVDQAGPATITRLRVDLVCREHVQFTVGTETRTEDHDLHSDSLLDVTNVVLGAGQHARHDLAVTLPDWAPHSFRSANNAVAWFVRVRAEITGWPDYDELLELRVLPRPAT